MRIPRVQIDGNNGGIFSSLFLFCNNNGIWKFNAWREKLYQKALVMENPCFSICKSRYVLQTHSHHYRVQRALVYKWQAQYLKSCVLCTTNKPERRNVISEKWGKGPSSRIVKCPICIYRVVNLSLPHIENNCRGTDPRATDVRVG